MPLLLFKSQVWGEGLMQAPLGATLYSKHYVTYGSSTKSMNTDAYLQFIPSWPLPFSADSEITAMSEDLVVVQEEEIENILRDDVVRDGEDEGEVIGINESIDSVLNSNLQDEEIDNSVKEARYLAGTKVPVYGFDGKSVIGEFVIDIR